MRPAATIAFNRRLLSVLLASAAIGAATPAPAFTLDDWLDGRFGGTALRVMPQTAFAPRAVASFATLEYQADYGLAKINAAQAYALGYTGKGVLVAVVDTGLDTSLSEFAGRISPWSRNFGFDRPIGSSDIRDIDSHGTHVAGTIAAGRDGVGMHGVAYNAEILALRAIVNGVGGDTAAAIAYAAERGAKVLNGSYGPSYPSRFLPDGRANPDYEVLPAQPYGVVETDKEVAAIRKAGAADMLLVFAAGNDGQDQPIVARDPSGAGFYPFIRPENYASGKYGFIRDGEEVDGRTVDYSDLQPYTLVVVAVDKDNRIASFSNRCGVAAAWCLAAPGVDIVSTMPRGSGAGGGDYDAKNGTSMAAPHVAGAAALVREAFPFFSAPNVATTLLTTASSLGDPTIYGWGLLNVGKALRGPAQFASTFSVDTKGGSGTFANDISGPGRLVKRGEGRLELTGANSYAGGTAILGGTLALNGSLASSVTVERDGALRGTGRIDASLASFGTVRPGNSPGTLTVTGPIGFSTTSRLVFDIDGTGTGAGAGNYARLIGLGASASVTAGGRLAPVLRGIDGAAGNSFTPALGQSFAVLVAGGGLSGSFSGLDQPSDGLPRFTRFDALYRPDALDLVVTPASYAGLSALGLPQNGNARAVGSAIDAARPAAGTRPDSTQRELFDPLYTTTPTSLAATIGSLSGQSYADAMKAQLGGSRLLAGAIDRRLADAASGAGYRRRACERSRFHGAVGTQRRRCGQAAGHARGSALGRGDLWFRPAGKRRRSREPLAQLLRRARRRGAALRQRLAARAGRRLSAHRGLHGQRRLQPLRGRKLQRHGLWRRVLRQCHAPRFARRRLCRHQRRSRRHGRRPGALGPWRGFRLRAVGPVPAGLPPAASGRRRSDAGGRALLRQAAARQPARIRRLRLGPGRLRRHGAGGAQPRRRPYEPVPAVEPVAQPRYAGLLGA